jgi:hypothetical protein
VKQHGSMEDYDRRGLEVEGKLTEKFRGEFLDA